MAFSEASKMQDHAAAMNSPAAALAHETTHAQRTSMEAPLVSPPLESEGQETDTSNAAATAKVQAAFVTKLYSMVEDPAIPELRWSASGLSFIVTSPVDFAKCLHNYFKHNNWQSFVRQLNMYQFHKVNDVFHTANGIKSSETAAWEFKHTYFRRGCVEMLAGIKRKASKPATPTMDSAGSGSPREVFSPQPNEYRKNHPLYMDNGQNYTHHSIASIEASQRMLMDQNAAIFSTLRSYQAVLGGMLHMLGSGQCSQQQVHGLQQELHAMSHQLNHAQFPNRAQTHVTAAAVPSASPNPYWQNQGGVPDSPAGSAPAGSAPISSPRDFYSPQIGHVERDSYFRSPPPPHSSTVPPSSARSNAFANFRSPVIPGGDHKHWQQGNQLPPIPTPPMSDSSRDGRDGMDMQALGFVRPAMPARGRSLQSLLNTMEPDVDDRKRRRGAD